MIPTITDIILSRFTSFLKDFCRSFKESRSALKEPVFRKFSESLQRAYGELTESFLSESFWGVFGDLSESFQRAFGETVSESFQRACVCETVKVP